MRKSTALWLLLAAFCGTALFHTSQKVHDNREKITALNREVEREEESIRVLDAEWSYLNQPARLEKLAREYLNLVPLKGSQFVKADILPLRNAATAPIVEEEKKSTLKVADKIVAAPPQRARLPQQQEKPLNEQQASSNSRKFGDVMKSLGVE